MDTISMVQFIVMCVFGFVAGWGAMFWAYAVGKYKRFWFWAMIVGLVGMTVVFFV